MNIFNKIERNRHHGGVVINLEALQSISRQDESLDVAVTLINNSKETRIILNVDAQIQATENNSNYGMALNNVVQRGNTTDTNEMYAMQTIIIADATETTSFTLQPNESKHMAFTLTFNSSFVQSKVAHYKYKLQVDAKVEGIDLNPKAHQDLQIL